MTPLVTKPKARVRIVGDHPHRGRSGTVRDDKPTLQGLWLIDLDTITAYETDGCYAAPENLRALPPSEDPHA